MLGTKEEKIDVQESKDKKIGSPLESAIKRILTLYERLLEDTTRQRLTLIKRAVKIYNKANLDINIDSVSRYSNNIRKLIRKLFEGTMRRGN